MENLINSGLASGKVKTGLFTFLGNLEIGITSDRIDFLLNGY